jgi:hypothetical protein
MCRAPSLLKIGAGLGNARFTNKAAGVRRSMASYSLGALVFGRRRDRRDELLGLRFQGPSRKEPSAERVL